MVVVLGLVVRGSMSIAQLGQLYSEVSGQRLARSSFWARLTPRFAKLAGWLLDEVVAGSRAPGVRPPGGLSGFQDVLAVDSSVVSSPRHHRCQPSGSASRYICTTDADRARGRHRVRGV